MTYNIVSRKRHLFKCLTLNEKKTQNSLQSKKKHFVPNLIRFKFKEENFFIMKN